MAKNSEDNHLKAFKLIEDNLTDGALILIDDIHDYDLFPLAKEYRHCKRNSKQAQT